MNPMKQSPTDPEIAKAYDWLKGFTSSQQWINRKANIESYIDSVFEAKKSRDAVELEPIAIHQ